MVDDENLPAKASDGFVDDVEDLESSSSQRVLLPSQDLEDLVGLTFAGITVVEPPRERWSISILCQALANPTFAKRSREVSALSSF